MSALRTLGGIISYGFQSPKNVPVEYSFQRIGERDLWELDDANNPYGVATALRCMQIIASAVAGCPLRAVNRETREEEQIPGFVATDELPTPFELIETMVLHLVGWGNTFVRKQYGKDGKLLGLGVIHPNTVRVTHDVRAAQEGRPVNKKFHLATGKVLTQKDILHVAGPSDDGVVGLSVVAKAARVLAAARENDKTAERLGRQGLRIPGILSTDQAINEDIADKIQKKWAEKTAGAANAGKVPVLSHGLSFRSLDMSPSDAQFLESRKFSVTEIARLFGLPGWMVNDQEKATSWGTGMEQQFISFVTLTLKPFMQRIEKRVTLELLDYEHVKAEFKVEGLLRGDSRARAAFYNAGIQGGWLVPNNIRPLEDLPNVPWGDEPYLPFNQSAASQLDDKENDDDSNA